MQDQIHTLKQQALDDLQQVSNTESLPGWFRDYLGKKGAVTALLKQLGTVAAEERPQVGKAINDLKAELQDSFDALQERLRQQKMEQEIASDSIDVTLPGRPFPTGHLHLTTQTLRKIYQIFAEMGFKFTKLQMWKQTPIIFRRSIFPSITLQETCGIPSGSTRKWCYEPTPRRVRFEP